MNKKKCPKCGSIKTKKNGQRNGVQLYKCTACNHQFRGGQKVSIDELWEAYMNGKQTIRELASIYHVSLLLSNGGYVKSPRFGSNQT